MSFSSRLAEQLVTHLGHILVKRVDGRVGILLHALGGRVELLPGIFAVLFQLCVDFRGFRFGVFGKLVYLAADLRAGEFGVLLRLFARSREAALDVAGDLGCVGWWEAVLEESLLMHSLVRPTFGLLLGDLGVSTGLVEVVSNASQQGGTANLDCTATHVCGMSRVGWR